jgi:undecaprenyl-diphosphatase
MDWLEALILGILQGLTEFLPVSSSGHLEIGKALLSAEASDNLVFTVAVHGATVLSTIVVFRKDILELLRGLFKFEYNTETKYILILLFSAIPVLIVGLFFKDTVESFFSGNLLLVGLSLLVTAGLLLFTHWAKDKLQKVSYGKAFIIGIGQALAVIPGISRAGTTISTALLLGVSKEKAARFSFLMVLVPIIGANFLSALQGDFTAADGPGIGALLIGFTAAFIAGLFACSWMISIVKKGKLTWFALYCFIIGSIAIIYSLA